VTPPTPVPARVAQLDLNGQPVAVAVEPRQTLLDVLRRHLGLSGTKEVCDMGNCGACTVLVDGDAVYSCLLLAVECEGHAIETVEGLADGSRLSPVQQAFVDCDALQCGFCTPGQVLSVEALLRRDPTPGDDAIVEALSGNLCRCGAYRHILDAARRAATARAGQDERA
jgi:xanthine dehydrogenase YagT iron-sulfur-binding subunit